MAEFALGTGRLVLRDWREEDAAPYHAMCTDPAVMRYLGPRLTDAEAEAAVTSQRAMQARLGYCFWALERSEDGVFLGFCGLKPGAEGTPIEDGIEIGWRLAGHAWGKGYAREAAQASLGWAWGNLPDARIWAITVPDNARSRGLMERLGMAREPALDFDHPALAPGNPLRAHVTYSIGRPAS